MVKPELIPKNPTLLDFGAHKGMFTAQFLKRFGGHAYAFEPNIYLHHSFFVNMARHELLEQVLFYPFAISDKTNTTHMTLDNTHPGQGSSLIPRECLSDCPRSLVVTASIHLILDLIKKIEGAEDRLLSNRLTLAKQVCVECHPDINPLCTKDFVADRLSDIGFDIIFGGNDRRPEILGFR